MLWILTAVLLGAARAAAQSNDASIDASEVAAFYSALPSSAIAAIASNPSAWVSRVASKIAAGNTPSWVDDIPSDAQNLFESVAAPTASNSPSATVRPSYSNPASASETSSYSSDPASESDAPSSSEFPDQSSTPAPSLSTTSQLSIDFSTLPESSVPESTPTAESKSESSTPAIAGGVVGGVVGVGAIAAAVIFFLVRRKKKQYRPAMREISS